MELKEYTKNLKNEPLLNNSRCSYYFYRFPTRYCRVSCL